jgi:hypothetical protein
MMEKRRASKTYSREEFGDFQTPAELVDLVLRRLYTGDRWWSRALEPTCGTGSFVKGLMSLPRPPREIQAVEVQPSYVEQARTVAKVSTGIRVLVHQADLFKHNIADLRWNESGQLLVVGNPPWVTNSALSALGSGNLPTKTNFKNLKGLDALTGDANFDIAEYMWLKLIRELAWCRPTIALLCKTQVARNVLQFGSKTNLPLSNAAIYRIDAKKWFGAAVDACLFSVDVGFAETNYDATIFDDLSADKPHSVMGVARGSLVAHSANYERLKFIDGECGFTWRQGLKHDLSSVMELEKANNCFVNKLEEKVDVEDEYVYPLLKSSDLANGEIKVPRYHVIVPQRTLGEDTSELMQKAPRVWRYLRSHQREFDARKSTIYVDRPAFSIFGIGPYSFAPYKVGVSGLYKRINFKVVAPWEGKSVMLDDTCYFIPCESAEQACVIACLLSQPNCIEFVHSLVFMDSKRPVTKRVLQRINLSALLPSVDGSKLAACVRGQLASLGLVPTDTPLEEHIIATPTAVPSAQYGFCGL